MKIPGYTGQLVDKFSNSKEAQQAAALFGGPMVASAIAGKKLSDDASGQVAEKLGMGQYKPGDVGAIDETPFRDMHRAEQYKGDIQELKRQAQARSFQEAQAAQLGDASQMTAAQLANAERIQAAQLGQDQLEFRAGQQDLISALQQQAAGQGPSLAGAQLDDARQQQIETAMALAASQRGLGAGQGLRSIAQQTQEAGQFAAREAARARIAEQLAARQQLSGALAGARAQDIGVAESQAGLEQQASLANQAAANQFAMQQAAMEQDAASANQAALNQFALQQAAMEQQTAMQNQQAGLQFQAQQDALVAALTNQMGQIGMAQDQRLMDLARLQSGRDLGLEELRAQGYAGKQQSIGRFLDSLAGAGARVATGS